MLDIVASCHPMQLQGKLIQLKENDKTPHFGPDLGLLGSNSGHLFFKNPASLVTRYHGHLSSCKISENS